MGNVLFLKDYDKRWVNLDGYTELEFFYDWKSSKSVKRCSHIGILKSDKWPAFRTWLRDNCDGEVFIDYGSNGFAFFLQCYFQYESDAVACKVVWSSREF
jgi:hypothetical protein